MPWDGDVFEIWTEVAGVSHPNNDGSSRQKIIRKYCREGADLGFAPEPRNRFDSDAISVWVEAGRGMFGARRLLQVGYVPREHLAEMHKHRLDGGEVSGTVWKVVGGGRGQYYGLRINIRLLPLEGQRTLDPAAKPRRRRKAKEAIDLGIDFGDDVDFVAIQRQKNWRAFGWLILAMIFLAWALLKRR